MRIFKEPVALYYFVAAFLTNIRCSIYGSQTSEYFQCEKADRLSMTQYINLVSVDELRDIYNLNDNDDNNNN